MPKEWILNSANMRWGLQRKKQVGAVAEEIRKCSPHTLEEWETYYYSNVRSREHLVELGGRLYTKVTEVLRAEVDSITLQDCIDFIINLVINRTYEGYVTEKVTVYGQLEHDLGVQIKPAPDEWDRLYNVDFFIQVGQRFIGLQIKPAAFPYLPQIIAERTQQAATHRRFRERYGGQVFYVISVSEGGRKRIYNPEVIGEIRAEIARLTSAA